MNNTIDSENLTLICGTREILGEALKGDDYLAAILQAKVPKKWTEFGMVVIGYALDIISENPLEDKWWTWLPIHKKDKILIGSCGYKGSPEDGMVEIGYEIIESYRENGYGTEIAQVLIKNAFDYPEVSMVQAHTLAEENASTRILTKCGLKWVEEIEDEEDGWIWRWIIERSDFKG